MRRATMRWLDAGPSSPTGRQSLETAYRRSSGQRQQQRPRVDPELGERGHLLSPHPSSSTKCSDICAPTAPTSSWRGPGEPSGGGVAWGSTIGSSNHDGPRGTDERLPDDGKMASQVREYVSVVNRGDAADELGFDPADLIVLYVVSSDPSFTDRARDPVTAAARSATR
jgi:uncharacterized protein (UPF0297 family)